MIYLLDIHYVKTLALGSVCSVQHFDSNRNRSTTKAEKFPDLNMFDLFYSCSFFESLSVWILLSIWAHCCVCLLINFVVNVFWVNMPGAAVRAAVVSSQGEALWAASRRGCLPGPREQQDYPHHLLLLSGPLISDVRLWACAIKAQKQEGRLKRKGEYEWDEKSLFILTVPLKHIREMTASVIIILFSL